MNCEKCGQDNAVDAKSCTWCGTPLIPQAVPNLIPHRDLGQLISHTFGLYRRNFWQFILIGLPPQILGLITLSIFPGIPRGFTSEFGSEIANEAAFDELAVVGPPLFLIGLLTFLAVVIVWAATVHAVGNQYLGQNIDVVASLRRGFAKTWILIASAILAWLALALSGVLILVLVGIPLIIFLMISWAFVFQLIVIEGAGPVAALGGSYRLAKGSRWRILGIGFVFFLIEISLQILMTVVTGVVDDISPPLATVISGVLFALLAPVMFIGLTVLYFDLRARKEGLTLESLSFELVQSSR